MTHTPEKASWKKKLSSTNSRTENESRVHYISKYFPNFFWNRPSTSSTEQTDINPQQPENPSRTVEPNNLTISDVMRKYSGVFEFSEIDSESDDGSVRDDIYPIFYERSMRFERSLINKLFKIVSSGHNDDNDGYSNDCDEYGHISAFDSARGFFNDNVIRGENVINPRRLLNDIKNDILTIDDENSDYDTISEKESSREAESSEHTTVSWDFFYEFLRRPRPRKFNDENSSDSAPVRERIKAKIKNAVKRVEEWLFKNKVSAMHFSQKIAGIKSKKSNNPNPGDSAQNFARVSVIQYAKQSESSENSELDQNAEKPPDESLNAVFGDESFLDENLYDEEIGGIPVGEMVDIITNELDQDSERGMNSQNRDE